MSQPVASGSGAQPHSSGTTMPLASQDRRKAELEVVERFHGPDEALRRAQNSQGASQQRPKAQAKRKLVLTVPPRPPPKKRKHRDRSPRHEEPMPVVVVSDDDDSEGAGSESSEPSSPGSIAEAKPGTGTSGSNGEPSSPGVWRQTSELYDARNLFPSEWAEVAAFPYAHVSPAMRDLEGLFAGVGKNKICIFRKTEAVELIHAITDKSGVERSKTDPPEHFKCVAWSVDRRSLDPSLAVAGDRGVIKLIDPRSGRVTGWLHGHGGPVLTLCFSRTHPHVLASGSADHTIRIWDVRLATPPLKPPTVEAPNPPSPPSPPSPPHNGTSLADRFKADLRASLSPQKAPTIATLRAAGITASRSVPNLGKPDLAGGRTLRDRREKEKPQEPQPKKKGKGKKAPPKKIKVETKPAWQNPEGQIVAILAGIKGHTSAVLSLDWHPTHPLLASSGADHTIKIWHLPHLPPLPEELAGDDFNDGFHPTLALDREDPAARRRAPISGHARRPANVIHFPLFSSGEVHEHWIDHVSWLGPTTSALVTRASVLRAGSKHPFAGAIKPRTAGQANPYLAEICIWKPSIIDAVFGPAKLDTSESLAAAAKPTLDLGENNLAFEPLWRTTIQRPRSGHEDVGYRKDLWVSLRPEAVEVGYCRPNGKIQTVLLKLNAPGSVEMRLPILSFPQTKIHTAMLMPDGKHLVALSGGTVVWYERNETTR